MQYVIKYEIASVFVCALIQILFFSRNSFITRSSRIFFVLLTSCMLTTVFDIISAYTISDPSIVPLFVNYIISAGYVFFYICNAFLFLLYVDSITKIPRIEKTIKTVVNILFIYEALLYVTSPFTKFLIYFDDNLVYRHGPMFIINYLIGLLALIVAVVLTFKGRVKISKYQRTLVMLFVVVVCVAIAYQVYQPDILLGGFIISLMVLYLYICFENPAFSFYLDTKCYNRTIFGIVIKKRIRLNKPTGIVVANVDQYAKYEKQLSRTDKENFGRGIAEKISGTYKSAAFMLDKHSFAIIVDSNGDDLSKEKEIQKSLRDIFESGINLSNQKLKINLHSEIIPAKFKFDTTDDLDKTISAILNLKSHKGELSDKEIYERAETVFNRIKRYDDVVRAIERAIEKNSFKVYYQPIYNVSTGKFASAEALVRLIDDKVGFIPPDEFIPIAEEKGLVGAVDESVFRNVCRFINSVDRKALGLEYIEVNLSPIQCVDPGIGDKLFSIMEETNTDPFLINFEITETAEAVHDEGSIMVDNIIDMNSRGLKFSVDDFGSGFATMDYLFSLPVDLVKLDRSILWQAMENTYAMIVLKNTFKMIKELNMKILVEGVETQEMVDLLKSEGCNFMQGFFFSKPVPEADYIEFLKANN